MIERTLTLFGILALLGAAALYGIPRLFPSERPVATGDGIDISRIIAERTAKLAESVPRQPPAEVREIMKILAPATEENAMDCVGKLRQVVAERGESAVRRAAVGWALLIAREPEEARKELDRAFEIDPDCPLAFAASAYEHLRHRRFKSAEESFRRAIGGLPTAVEWRRMHSLVLLATGRSEEALTAAEYAVALAPRSPVGYLAAGDVHLRQGRLAAALRWYEAACRIAGAESKTALEHEPVLKAMRERIGV